MACHQSSVPTGHRRAAGFTFVADHKRTDVRADEQGPLEAKQQPGIRMLVFLSDMR
jgi:hypothetical protein